MSRMLFLENAFGILGLSTDATDRDITKRSKEIERLLSIDETPSYDGDLPFVAKNRNEKNVKDAVRALMSDSHKIAESFFWLAIKDSHDAEMLKHLKKEEYGAAQEIVQSKILLHPNDTFALKNKAVIDSIAYGVKRTTTSLRKSVKGWAALMESDKHWNAFWKVYQLNNPGVSESVFTDFKNKAEGLLSDYYASAVLETNDYTIYEVFSDVFTKHGAVLNEKIISPILIELDSLAKELDEIKLEKKGSPGEISNVSLQKIKNATNKIDAETDKLYSLGKNVWNSSKISRVRDEVAVAIRGKLLEYVKTTSDLLLHGHFFEALVELESQLAASSLLKQKSEDDMQFFEDERNRRKFLKALEDKDYDNIEKYADLLLETEKNPNNRDAIIRARDIAKAAQARIRTSSSGYQPRTVSDSDDVSGAVWFIIGLIVFLIWLLSSLNS